MLSLRRIVPALTVALLPMLAGSGCANLKDFRLLPERKAKPSEPAAVPKSQLVGTVTLVNMEGRYVLIDTGGGGAPAIGVALKSFTGESESGVLIVGGIQRRPFLIADIVKGAPQKGDQVFQ